MPSFEFTIKGDLEGFIAFCAFIRGEDQKLKELLARLRASNDRLAAAEDAVKDAPTTT